MYTVHVLHVVFEVLNREVTLYIVIKPYIYLCVKHNLADNRIAISCMICYYTDIVHGNLIIDSEFMPTCNVSYISLYVWTQGIYIL